MTAPPRHAPATPSATPPAAALRWLAATSLAYVTLYALANHLTSQRADVGRGVFSWERAIPFIDWTIIPYLSIVGFFALSFFIDSDPRRLRLHVVRLAIVLVLSVLCYAAFPLRFTFDRPQTHGLPGLLFDLLGACDLPYNRAPSLHIGVLVVLWARLAPSLRGGCRWALHAWFLMIAVSVLTTYQHHVLDVPAGAALGLFAVLVTRQLGARAAAPSTGPASQASRATTVLRMGAVVAASAAPQSMANARLARTMNRRG